jgi:hypothetical protein
MYLATLLAIFFTSSSGHPVMYICRPAVVKWKTKTSFFLSLRQKWFLGSGLPRPQPRDRNQGCQMVYFHTKNPNFWYILEVCIFYGYLVYSTVIHIIYIFYGHLVYMYILRLYGIHILCSHGIHFYAHMVYIFMAIWNILRSYGIHFYCHLVILWSFGNFVVIWYIFHVLVSKQP